MIRVLIPSDSEFKEYENELKNLYEKNQKSICDTNSFHFIRDNTLFYAFIYKNKLLGSIYYFQENDKLFLNGFAYRHQHLLNLECLKLTLNWFKTDIYAEAQNKSSALCLLKCGFKKVGKKLFVYKHN